MKTKILIAALLLAGSAHADTNWVNISKDKASSFDIRVGSYEERQVNAVDVYSVLFRYTDLKTNRIDIMRWNVTSPDCARQYGTLIATEIASNQVIINSAFVFKGGNVASLVAETICGIHNKTAATNI